MWMVAARMQLPLQAVIAIAVLILVTATSFTRPRLATGGGLLLGVGLSFGYLFVQAASRCTPDTSCHLGDNSVQIAIAGLFLFAGAALSTIAVRKQPAHA
jgi:hypothetical protein